MSSAAKKLVFNNTAEELYPLTMEAIAFLKLHTAIGEVAVRKVKLVLMELLTNALKHSGGCKAEIELIVNDDTLTIIKSDTGNTFVATFDGCILQWPLPGRHHAGRTLFIYGDESSGLKGVLKNNCHIRFFVEEYNETLTGVRDLPEHFGLMIIARACKVFEYEFNVDTCTNNFRAIIAIE